LNDFLNENETMGNNPVTPTVIDYSAVKPDHAYKITFGVDTVAFKQKTALFRHEADLYYINNSITVTDVTLDSVVYQENPQSYVGENIVTEEVLEEYERTFFNPRK
jgi:uncharacterized protein YraI